MHRNEFPSSSTLAAFDHNSDPLPPLIAARVKEFAASRLRPNQQYPSILGGPRFAGQCRRPPSLRRSASTTSLMACGPCGHLHQSRWPEHERHQDEKPRRTSTRGGIEEQLKAEPRKQFLNLRRGQTANVNCRRQRPMTFAKLVQKIVKTISNSVLCQSILAPVSMSSGFAISISSLRGSVTQQQSTDTAFVVIERNQVNAAALQALILANELDSEDWSQAAELPPNTRLSRRSVDRRQSSQSLQRPVTESTIAHSTRGDRRISSPGRFGPRVVVE